MSVTMALLKLAFEIALLLVMLKAGIRELSDWAIFLIALRLIVSFISRLFQIPGFLDESELVRWGVYTCFVKIALEALIFFAVKEDITISMDFVILILLLMFLRNISDTWSLLAIGLDE